jgi:hypothetical protein
MRPLPLEQGNFHFEALEQAVRETSRGRAFLDEFAKRVRASDTDRILTALGDLKTTLTETVTTPAVDVLRRELETMAASIAQTRREIASIRPDGPGNNRIVMATEELDFVVQSTERATSEILTSAERILNIVAELKSRGVNDPLCDELDMHGTNLMTACSFQDLTGQRMSKVVNTLRYLEIRVNSMIEIWGITHEDAASNQIPAGPDKPDGHLLNGPAREGEGVGQDDIDRLLNGEASAPEPPPPGSPASQDDIDALFQ